MTAPPATAPAPAPPSARQLSWDRRRRALAAFWREFRKDRSGMVGLIFLIVLVILALAAPLLANSRGLSAALSTNPANAGPGWHYPLGTDADGRSVLTELIWGARISLLIGFTATLLSMVIGAVVGIVAGHFGKVTDNLLMRVTDWFLVVPFLPLAIVLAKTLGPSLGVIIFVIGITSWPGTARIIRAQALAVETRPYLERSRALGAGHWHQMVRHVLPNVDAAAAGQHDPDRGRRDPGRDHAVLPGPGRPAPAVLGRDAQRGVHHRRRHGRQPDVADRARHRDHPGGAGLHAGRPRAGAVLNPKLRERR